MAPVVALVVAVAPVVGTIASVVTMVKGIKDGNLFQAIAGGFGAFMGVSSLMGSAASGSAAAASTGAEAAGAMSSTAPASWAAQVDPTGAFSTASTNTAATGMTTAGLTQGATDALVSSGSTSGLLTGDATTQLISNNTSASLGTSLGDTIVNGGKQLWAGIKENPELVKAGAGLLTGYSQGAAVEEKMKREEEQAAQARSRKGYWAAPTTSLFQP